jgi:RNA polymerase sigma factor (sigma-70 family)
LRLRSDEQLVSLFRAGSDDAFRVIHDRYHARLLAYGRQMLRGSSGDAEDAMQDVFVRAFKSLRASNRPVMLRAWLYRIAHNRCIDELRRPTPIPTLLDTDARPALASAAAATSQDPSLIAERSETMARLVADVQTLPAPQRSALLMRELQGLSYQELSETLGISVPAVKSLLLRARTGLVDLKIARDTPCEAIQLELAESSDRGVRMNARCRRHVRECAGCRAYHRQLRSVHKRLAALAPLGPLAKLTGLFSFGSGSGGAGGGVAAGTAAGGTTAGGTAAGGTAVGGTAVGGGVAGSSASVISGVTAATAVKVAAVVATAAVIGTAAPAALQAVSAPPRPAATAVLPADAHSITQVTGATVGPGSSSASVNAGLATPLRSGGSTIAQTDSPLGGASGATGTTGVSGATGATGSSGSSGATGYIVVTGGATATSEPGGGATVTTTAPPVATAPDTETAGTTGPTATKASVPSGPTSESIGSSGVSGRSGASGRSGSTSEIQSP